MIFAVCAITLLYLSVSRSAPLACEELVRPLDPLVPRHLEGKWALVAGSLSHVPFLERFKQRDSAAVNFSRSASDTHVTYTRSIRLEDKCLYNSYNISLEGSSFSYVGANNTNSSANFISSSCTDCMLMHMSMETGKRQHLYLFSRRRQLEQEEMEEFRAQVGCLNMPPPAVMNPGKELCPDQTADDPAGYPEEKRDTAKN